MRNQSLAVAVFAGLLSVQGFAVGAEAPAAGRAPTAAPAAPAPAHAAPAPAAPAPARAAPPAPANNPRPAPARPAQNGSNSNNAGAGRTPAGTNEQGRAPGSTLPPANAQEAQNRLRANEQRTAQNGERRNERDWGHGRGRGQGQTIYYGGYMPYSWWYNGDSYWSQPYENYPNNDQQANNGGTAPAAPAQNMPTPGSAPTPAQDQAKSTNQLEAAPSYRQAVADMAKAQAAYDSASAKVLEKLKTDPKYQSLIQQRDHAEDKVEAVQAAAKIPSPEQVTPIAQKKLDLSSKITHMEQDAIQADPDAAAAKSRLVDLNAQVQTFKKQAQSGQ
jgi:hypothetical protein